MTVKRATLDRKAHRAWDRAIAKEAKLGFAKREALKERERAMMNKDKDKKK